MIFTGDCVAVMAGMEPESVDAIVTDPPYGLTFMGKDWDRLGAIVEAVTDTQNRDGNWTSKPFGGGRQRVRYGTNARSMQDWHTAWATAALRVAKPGAYLLAFGGTRTVHRLTVALEDAGWIIRDVLIWCYASGFPKSKASLKPAYEPIVLCRKPGPLRELGIDACRIGTSGGGTECSWWPSDCQGHPTGSQDNPARHVRGDAAGRWPANVILTDPIFDGGWEGVVGGGTSKPGGPILGDKEYADIGYHGNLTRRSAFEAYGDEGTYSRFFILPKASRSDREPLVPGELEEAPAGALNMRTDSHSIRNGMNTAARRNTHPTCKPTELMRHLVRLVTPQGGTVLDPFLGSGSTAIAAEQEGFAWIGVEREPEYVAIAEQRLVAVQRGLGLDVPAPTPRARSVAANPRDNYPKRRSPSENYSGSWAGQETVAEQEAGKAFIRDHWGKSTAELRAELEAEATG